jgi:ABC-type microcin C transport system permease subunit YejE
MYKKYRAFIKSSKTLNLYYKIVLVWCYIALLAPLIANDRPLFCNYENNWLFPAFSFKNQHTVNIKNKSITINYNMSNDWKKLPCSTIVFPLCAYSPKTIDAINAPFISPFDNQYQDNNTSLPWKYRHWLGTTQNGNDVLSGIINGSRIAILVGLLSIIIASIIGISLGSVAGYYEDKKIKIGIFESVFILIAFLLVYFYNFIVFPDSFEEILIEGGVSFFVYLLLSFILSIIGIMLFLLIGKKLDKILGITHKINFPIDLFISKKLKLFIQYLHY